jgi:hypothetical protein
LFQPHLKYILTFFHICTSCSPSFITTLKCTFFPVLVKGIYQTESYSIYILERQQIASQWGFQLIFRMHNSDPTPQGMENRNILLWFKCVLI